MLSADLRLVLNENWPGQGEWCNKKKKKSDCESLTAYKGWSSAGLCHRLCGE